MNEPAAPPVETMYRFAAATKRGTLAAAMAAPPRPAQLSLPHSPVAKAQVTTESSAGSTSSSGEGAPVTSVESTLVFQFRWMPMSLYGL